MNPNEDPLFDDNIDDADYQRPEPMPVGDILKIIANDLGKSAILPAGAVYGLSDMKGDLRDEFAAGWPSIPVEQRRRTIRSLAELCEDNFELNYEALAYIAFEDEDPEVRGQAVHLLWFDTSERLFHRVMRLADDASAITRAEAMISLGKFIYEAELEEFNKALAEQARDLAIDRYYDYTEDLDVRRRALEAAARGTHPAIENMIIEAYDTPDLKMRVSAVFAMGASCDTDRWGDTVLRELENENAELRFEAAKAAGELLLEEAVPMLIELAHEEDTEIRLASIASLGEIGTQEARRGLMLLADYATEIADGAMLEIVEESLEMASLMGGMMIPMFDFDEDDLPLPDDDFDD